MLPAHRKRSPRMHALLASGADMGRLFEAVAAATSLLPLAASSPQQQGGRHTLQQQQQLNVHTQQQGLLPRGSLISTRAKGSWLSAASSLPQRGLQLAPLRSCAPDADAWDGE